jgi:hypothetical protein
MTRVSPVNLRTDSPSANGEVAMQAMTVRATHTLVTLPRLCLSRTLFSVVASVASEGALMLVKDFFREHSEVSIYFRYTQRPRHSRTSTPRTRSEAGAAFRLAPR